MKRTSGSASARAKFSFWRHKESKTKNPESDHTLGSHVAIENQDLWDYAYKLLQDDEKNRKLIEAYEKVLDTEIEKNGMSLVVPTGSSREKQVSILVRKKIQDVEDTRWKFQLGDHTVEIRAQVDKLVKAVLFAKEFVSSAASTDPHAALAWAGVAMLLPLLQNPTSQQSALMAGVEYISTLIVRFTVIERNCRRREPWLKSSNPDSIRELNAEFETQVTKLYSQILCYEARVVCQMVRPFLLQYSRDIFKIDDWSTLIEDVKASEVGCTLIAQVVDSEKLEAAMKDVDRMLNEMFLAQTGRFDALQQTAEQTLAGVEQHRRELEDRHRTEEESKCLQALCTSTYEDYKDRNGIRVHGTCLWFLSHQKFNDWLSTDSSDLLLVTADPGCGKSVLCRSLIDDELQKGSITLAYFFFKDIGDQRSATHALCAILHQLCIKNPAVLQKTIAIYRDNGNQMVQSFSWLWKTFLTVSKCPAAGNIVCVLDALDECEEQGRYDLIHSLKTFYMTSGVEGRIKFLVTSRPYFYIEEQFGQRIIRVRGEDESEQIRNEIDLVIKDRVPDIASKKKLDLGTQDYLQKRLLSTENRTYLWLHLTLANIEKSLVKGTPKGMKEIIDTIPETVNDAYTAMLNQIKPPEKARRLLHIVIAAAVPLTLREMNMALHIEEGQKSREEVDLHPEEDFGSYLKNLCGLIVSIHHSRIYLLHQTAKEFLMAPENKSDSDTPRNLSMSAWKHSMELDVSNSILAKICIAYLLFAVFEDEPLRPHDIRSISNTDELIEFCSQYDFVGYASMYWASHFRYAREDSAILELWHRICNPLSHRLGTWIWCSGFDPIFSETMPLSLATYLGHDVIVEQLIGAGVNLEKSTSKSQSTPLILAARTGNSRAASILIQAGACTDVRDDQDYTPLWWALVNDDEVITKMLLGAKADVNVIDDEGRPLLDAVLYRRDKALLKSLLDAGASVHTPNFDGRTPLANVANFGDIVIAQSLLEAGARINESSKTGRTALHYACVGGEEAMVRFLLQAKADPNIEDRQHKRAIDIAIRRESRTVERKEKFRPIIRLLEPVTENPYRVLSYDDSDRESEIGYA